MACDFAISFVGGIVLLLVRIANAQNGSSVSGSASASGIEHDGWGNMCNQSCLVQVRN